MSIIAQNCNAVLLSTRLCRRVVWLAFFTCVISACDSSTRHSPQQNAEPITKNDSAAVFESGHVRPLALSEDRKTLFAVNTPDSRLEIFDVQSGVPVFLESVVVGLEPVAVAVRAQQAWVVNHLSDSISIVDFSKFPARVTRTLFTGDEPRDIVFAGVDRNRAFISAAHRGQNAGFDPEFLTPGVGRSDVWVFDRLNLGDALGGNPVTVVNMFGDTLRSLAASKDGRHVYAGVFNSGNRTTTIFSDVKNGGLAKPSPVVNTGGVPAPRTGLIVKYNGTDWLDDGDPTTGTLPMRWNDRVRFSLPDNDVFKIDATRDIPISVDSIRSVGTTLYNMAMDPLGKTLYVSNTEANNHIRFRGAVATESSLTGRFATNRLSVVTENDVVRLNLNARSNSADSLTANTHHSVASPQALRVSDDGQSLYLAAFGSGKIARYATSDLANGLAQLDDANYLTLTAGGPSGLALDDAGERLFVFTRFDNGISTVNTQRFEEVHHIKLYNPEPAHVIAGRPFLYDANLTSANGELSCAICHPFADSDQLAWDLGVPTDDVVANDNLYTTALTQFVSKNRRFHPMKGPMVSMPLRGLKGAGPMHWRGDRTGVKRDADETVEEQALEEFNETFVSLLGRKNLLSEQQMDQLARFLLAIDYPPNAVRALDNSLSDAQKSGERFFYNVNSAKLSECDDCHTIDARNNHFGTDGKMSTEGPASDEDFKIPHLRSLYQKVGMFGSAYNPADQVPYMGEQIRGFGFIHDGSVDTVVSFFKLTAFDTEGERIENDLADFVFAINSEHAPVVGQQVTVNAQTLSDSASLARLNLLRKQAAAPTKNCDLIVSGVLDNKPVGAFMNKQERFIWHASAAADSSLAELLARVQTPQDRLSFMCTPLGNGVRIGIDRDLDGLLNADEAS